MSGFVKYSYKCDECGARFTLPYYWGTWVRKLCDRCREGVQ